MNKNKNIKNMFALALVLSLVALFCGVAISAETVTILGTVNSDYQVVTDDDQVYDIAENEKGDELVVLVGQRVKVTGTVEEEGDAKVLTVTSFEVIKE